MLYSILYLNDLLCCLINLCAIHQPSSPRLSAGALDEARKERASDKSTTIDYKIAQHLLSKTSRQVGSLALRSSPANFRCSFLSFVQTSSVK